MVCEAVSVEVGKNAGTDEHVGLKHNELLKMIMKTFAIPTLLILTLTSCHSGSDSTSLNSNSAAVMPSAGNLYTYRVDKPPSNSGTAIQLRENAVIALESNSMFTVTRNSDSVGGFFTSCMGEKYQLLASKDLWPLGSEPGCDSTALPIASHRSFYSQLITTPTKKNGMEADGSVRWHTQYDGEEDIAAAGQTFSCSKVEKSVTVTASSGDPNHPLDTAVVTHIYWYSPIIQFFVKDELVTGDSNSFTRTLLSYKLAK